MSRTGPDADDLERPREADAADLIVERHVLLGAHAGEQIDARRDRVVHFLPFRNLRQLRELVEAAVMHRQGLAAADPADLLHAVIKLVPAAFGVVHIGMPVRARHVAARAVELHAAALQPARGVDGLLEAADLPGDLVDGMLRRQMRHDLEVAPREQHERMVVAVEAGEIADGLELALELGRHPVGEVEPVGASRSRGDRYRNARPLSCDW